MILFIAMAILAAAAALSVLVPLYRTRAGERSMAGQEAMIYRDQLDEVARDLDRGVIAATEANAARTEIARRLIRADGLRAAASPASDRRRTAATVAIVAGVPLLAVALYLALGSPDAPDLPLAARLAAPVEGQDVSVLVARVEEHLAADPDDAEGWEVVVPVYVRLGRFDDAVVALRNIVRLKGSTSETQANLGEAIVRANQGAVTKDAIAAFGTAETLDPTAVVPRFYLALALAQSGRQAEAVAALKELIAKAPPGAPWIPTVQGVLARVEGTTAPPAGAAAATAAEPGPAAADVDAAAALSPEQRSAMIEGMVGQLAARLETEPKDAAGWARLIRSYMVLGRKPDAEAALAKAKVALAGDDALLAVVLNEAKAQGLAE